MFTNFATAGVAIVGLVASSGQEDPTMAALKQITAQLEEMKKQLERIEGKIDDLSDQVLVGFERVLRTLGDISGSLSDFRYTVTGKLNDATKRKRLQII